MDINSCFPFKELRNNQEELITNIIKSFIEDKKQYVVLEAPTGVGKSVIAYTVATYLKNNNHTTKQDDAPNSIFCTSTRALQLQYINSFANQKNCSFIWSARNYDCLDDTLNELGIKYGDYMCLKKHCNYYNNCPYVSQKKQFMKSDIGITNYHYYLNNTKLNADFIVCDEAHNLEKILCNIATIDINTKLLKDIKAYIDKINTTGDASIKTLKKILDDIILSMMKLLNYIFKNEYDSDEELLKEITNYVNECLILVDKNSLTINKIWDQYFEKFDKQRIEYFKSHKISNIEEFIKNTKSAKIYQNIIYLDRIIKNINNKIVDKFHILNNFNCEFIISLYDSKYKMIVLKPLEINEFFIKYFGKKCKILFMSATICGYELFLKQLGIEEEKSEFYQTNSPIPIKNRKIISVPFGNLSYRNKHELLPKFINGIDRIFEFYPNEYNGIIHTVSYENAEYIKKYSIFKNRIIIPNKKDLTNIEDLINKNKEIGTIIASPSILEGIDLINDLSRIQIFLKVPFGFLGDKWIQAKMNNDNEWYARDAIIKIVQGCGRSIRSNDDFAYTFILDSNFINRIKNKYYHLVPYWFKEAIYYKNL